MDAIFTTFGIDWKLLLMQGINFGILLFGLWYFFYGPLSVMLEERRRTVAKGVEDAQKAAEELAGIEHSRAGLLATAGKEADTIVAEARSAAAKKEHELIAGGEAAAERIVREAEAQAAELKTHAIVESKEEVAKMIVLGVEKMLKEKSV